MYSNLFLGLMLVTFNAEVILKGTDFVKPAKVEKVEVLDAKEVKLKPGDSLRIQLPLQSGTGYHWQILGPEYGPLELKQSMVSRPMRPVPGAGIEQHFIFHAKKDAGGVSQQVVLIFNLRRPFEGIGAQIRQVRVIVGDS